MVDSRGDSDSYGDSGCSIFLGGDGGDDGSNGRKMFVLVMKTMWCWLRCVVLRLIVIIMVVKVVTS